MGFVGCRANGLARLYSDCAAPGNLWDSGQAPQKSSSGKLPNHLRSDDGVLGNCPVGRLAIGIATDICRYRSSAGRRHHRLVWIIRRFGDFSLMSPVLQGPYWPVSTTTAACSERRCTCSGGVLPSPEYVKTYNPPFRSSFIFVPNSVRQTKSCGRLPSVPTSMRQNPRP